MMADYTRTLTFQKDTFFLFGPRGTGKTTWLRMNYPNALWIDLLDSDRHLSLLKNPAQLRNLVEASTSDWVVIDEIQRNPSLLNEVHYILNRKKNIHFALTGSSARKIRQAGVNLLGGRAAWVNFFPFSYSEVAKDWHLTTALEFGTLPRVFLAKDSEEKIRLLNAYVHTYIREEIQQEALVKSLDSFARFLDIAALLNAQVLNMANIARDAKVARPTVQGYFKVLLDTLIGCLLPAWKSNKKARESSHPKFYFFDPGVVSALRGSLREPIDPIQRGWLLETLIFHEMRVAVEAQGLDTQWGYWLLPSKKEVDFIWKSHGKTIGIEVKSATHWKPEFSSPLQELISMKKINTAYGVYRGTDVIKDKGVLILPVEHFLQKLHGGKLF